MVRLYGVTFHKVLYRQHGLLPLGCVSTNTQENTVRPMISCLLFDCLKLPPYSFRIGQHSQTRAFFIAIPSKSMEFLEPLDEWCSLIPGIHVYYEIL